MRPSWQRIPPVGSFLSKVLAFVVTIAVSLPSAGLGQKPPPPLLGFRKVTTLIVFNATGREPSGISESRLRTVLELRLRQSGLQVLTDDENSRDPDVNPYVFLLVASLETKNRSGLSIGYSYSVSLSVRTFVTIPSNGSRAPAALWENSTLAIASTDDAPADITRIVGDLTDEFLNGWLAANPRR